MGDEAKMTGQSEKRVLDSLCAVMRGEEQDWPGSSELNFHAEYLESAVHHGVAPLICHLLKSSESWELLPDSLKASLLEQLRLAGAVEMIRKRDLLKLGKSFQQSGIKALLIKGAGLAYTHYPEPHLRTRVDTDIFIDTQDINTTRDVFQSLGYTLHGTTYKSHQFDTTSARLGGISSAYDVHWRASNASAYSRVLGHAEAWEKSIPVPGLGPWRTLNPPHALLLACIHRVAGSEHDPDRLIWLYDIHLLVAAMTESDLNEFAARAVAEGLQKDCLDGLNKAAACFATKIPPGVTAVLSTRVQHQTPGQRISSSQLGLIIDDLKELKGTRNRLAFAREFLMPSGEYLLNRYQKKSRMWVPWLYLRYLFGGLFQRLSLL